MVGEGRWCDYKGQQREMFVVTEQFCIWLHETTCDKTSLNYVHTLLTSILCSALFPQVVYLHHNRLHPCPLWSSYWGLSFHLCFHILNACVTVLIGSLLATQLMSTSLQLSFSPSASLCVLMLFLWATHRQTKAILDSPSPWPPFTNGLVCLRGLFLKFMSILTVTGIVPEPMNSSWNLMRTS